MQSVRVMKRELLDCLIRNKASHAENYRKGMEVYRWEAKRQLQKHLRQAKSGGKIEQSLNLVEPQSFLNYYDHAIMMLGMSVEDEIVLTQQDFLRYVMDEWEWKGMFENSTIGYSVKFRG